MLRDVIRFEWRYHTRQLAFAVGVVLFFGLGYALPVLGYGPAGTHLNAPIAVMQSVGLLSLLSIFVLTVFCANAVTRDAEHGMREIVHATPIGKFRQQALQLSDQAQGVVTYHPSYLLRVPDAETKAKAYAAFVEDLKFAWKLAA